MTDETPAPIGQATSQVATAPTLHDIATGQPVLMSAGTQSALAAAPRRVPGGGPPDDAHGPGHEHGPGVWRDSGRQDQRSMGCGGLPRSAGSWPSRGLIYGGVPSWAIGTRAAPVPKLVPKWHQPEVTKDHCKLLVRKGGFEPPRPCGRQPLKLVRLPVPPLPLRRGTRDSDPIRPAASSTTDQFGICCRIAGCRCGAGLQTRDPRLLRRSRRGCRCRSLGRSRRAHGRRLATQHRRRAAALPGDTERYRAHHEEHRRHRRDARQQRRARTGAERRLAAATAECAGDIAAAALLQQDDHQQHQANHHVEDREEILENHGCSLR